MLVPPTLNGMSAIRVSLHIPWCGMWVADVELDPLLVETIIPIIAAAKAAPVPAALQLGLMLFNGTIDPRGSGVFGERAHLRVVAGRGGWDKEVSAQHFPMPAGALISTLVYAATAAEVLELPPVDPIPELFGKNYARVKGPASAVFGDRQWFVEPTTGIAMVIPWPPLPPDPLWTIVDYDIEAHRATISSDEVILPGMVVADLRFGADTFIVRDVDQVFDSNGSKADVYFCDKAKSRLQEALKQMVRSFGETRYLKMYKYRYVLPVAGQLALQGITEGAPDLNPIDQWTGLAGANSSVAGIAALLPATEIVVGFAGSPAEPFVVAFSPMGVPLSTTIEALIAINLGATPTSPIALASGVLAMTLALQIEVAAIAAALTAVFNIPGPITPAHVTAYAPALAAVTASAAALAAGATLMTSKKVLSE